MAKELRDGKSVQKRPEHKLKKFFWRLVQIVFGLLFVGSIVVCILFATGVITITEDSKSGNIRLRFESPLVPKNEQEQSEESAPSESTENSPEQNSVFEGDDIGWGPAIDKDCEEGNSICEQNLQKLPSIANLDLDIDGLIYNASAKHPGEILSIADLRFTTNGRYVVAKLVSNLVQDKTVIVSDLYFYRSTYDSLGWSELNGLGNNQEFNCTELSDIQKLIIEDTYSEQGCASNEVF